MIIATAMIILLQDFTPIPLVWKDNSNAALLAFSQTYG